MAAPDLESTQLGRLLDAVGAHLEADRRTESVVVVGGAALCLRGWVSRTTQDVDVIASVANREGREWVPPSLSAELMAAVRRVARDFNLAPDWVNEEVGAYWKTGLPDGIRDDVDWLQFRGLRVGLAGRGTLITLKLYAAVDQWPDSVHLQDLLVLAPTDTELETARHWVERQDIGAGFPAMVAEVIEHVRRRR